MLALSFWRVLFALALAYVLVWVGVMGGGRW